MTSEDVREVLGIVGGTGPQGRGLAARWAAAGHQVHIGSRTQESADAAVADVRERLGDGGAAQAVRGGTNADVADVSQIVVVALPYPAQEASLPGLRDVIGDKIVCNVVNPMVFDDLGPKAVPVPEGSAAEQCQALLPRARVVSAFHDVSSRRLLRVGEPIETHVLICGDDDDAVHRVAHLASRIDGMWGVNCGPLRNSGHIENVTPVLLWINRAYKIQAGLLIDGIERDPDALHAHVSDGHTRAGRKR